MPTARTNPGPSLPYRMQQPFRKLLRAQAREGVNVDLSLLNSPLDPFFCRPVAWDFKSGCLWTVRQTPFSPPTSLPDAMSRVTHLALNLEGNGTKPRGVGCIFFTLLSWGCLLTSCTWDCLLSRRWHASWKRGFFGPTQDAMIKHFGRACVHPQICVLSQALRIILVYTHTWEPQSEKKGGRTLGGSPRLLAGHPACLRLLPTVIIHRSLRKKVSPPTLRQAQWAAEVRAPAVTELMAKRGASDAEQMQIRNTWSSEKIQSKVGATAGRYALSGKLGRKAWAGQCLCKDLKEVREGATWLGKNIPGTGNTYQGPREGGAWCVWEQQGGWCELAKRSYT